MNASALSTLLSRLDHTEGAQPANLVTTIEQLLKLLESLPSGSGALDALKKPGAWESVPLITATPDKPVWVKLPCSIDFEDITAAQLAALRAVPSREHSGSSTLSVGLPAAPAA